MLKWPQVGELEDRSQVDVEALRSASGEDFAAAGRLWMAGFGPLLFVVGG
jgi:hypothetical protein